MPIYGVSTRTLKDFVTSERDILRQITKIPSRDYRLWKVDLKKEERKDPEEDELDFENAEDFDDFVIVERVDMKKYNK